MTAARIALISAEYPPAPGGVGDYTACLAAGLARAGREVHVITTQRDSPPDSQEPAAAAEPGVTVHRVVSDWGWECWEQVGRVLFTLRPAAADIQYQTGAYRLHGAINLLPWRLRVLGLPWVATFHDLREPYLFPKAGPARRWANAILMRHCRVLVVTNPQDEAALPAWARGRTIGIPIGANIPRQPPAGWDRAAWRVTRDIPPEAVLIAYFGFLNASKGLDVLLEAVATLRQSGQDYRLLLAGGSTGESDPTNAATAVAVEEQIRALGIGPVTHVTGYVAPEEVSAALLSADLAALPFRDGASLRRGSLLAVLAHGLPTVTTLPAPTPPVPTTWPALHDGENALLVPPADTSALAGALARLAGDPVLRARLHMGALDLATQFSWDGIAARHLALFDSLSEP